MAQQYVPTTWVAGAAPSITAQRLNNIETGLSLASAPVVTALPTAPANGQECNLRVKDVGGNTIAMWHLVYCSDEPGNYKWVYTGGAALFSYVDGNAVINTRGYAAYGGPSLVLPLAGDYEVSYGARAIADAGAGGHDVQASYSVNGAAPIDDDGINSYSAGGTSNAMNSVRTRTKVGLPVGCTLVEQAYSDVGNAGLSARWLRAVPRRVGVIA